MLFRSLVNTRGGRFQEPRSGNAVIRRVSDVIGRYRDIGGSPDRGLAHVIRIRDEIAGKPGLTPRNQIRPITRTPNLTDVGIPEVIDALGYFRGQTTGGDSNESTNVRQSAGVWDRPQDSFFLSYQPPVNPCRAALTLGR